MAPILAVVMALGAVLLGHGRLEADPGPVGSEFRVSEDTPGHAVTGALAMNAGGDFVVVWTEADASSDDVHARRFDAAAQPLGAAFQVNTYTSGSQSNPGIAAAASGDFVVAWTSVGSPLNASQDGSSRGVFAQRFTNAGVPVGAEFQVNTYTTSNQRSPAVAADPTGNLMITWQSEQVGIGDSGIFAQRYDAAGVPQGTELQVNTTLHFEAGPQVAADGAGNFVVVWADFTGGGISRRILAQRFDASGTPIGSEFQVNVSTNLSHFDPDVAATAAGSFVIVWTDDYEILARRYDSAGTPLTMPFQVTPAGRLPAVATNTAGTFVVVWEAADSDGRGIFGRRYDGTGNALGDAFQVNTYTPEGQSDPDVGLDATGAFVVLWTSPQDADDEFGVFGQRFDAAGDPVPSRVPISGASLTIVDGGPTRRSVKFRAKDGKTADGINPLINPTIQGVTLQVFNASGSGDSACFTLPASGWEEVGSPDNPLFVYRDRGFANGPCSLARIWRGRFVRASCSSQIHPVTYTLDEPMQGSVGVSLTVGPATYCALFGGTVHIDDPTRHRFRATAAPKPPTCPVPPAACP